MFLSNSMPVLLAIPLFVLAAVIIAVYGIRMTHVARQLAQQTGMGEALMGAVFIGASTSLSGIVTSTTAAANGFPAMAVSNALGGIAAQTLFLAIADMFYRKANLEHAAASAENLMMGAFLITLLSILLLAMMTPEMSLLNIHPLSLVLVFSYGMGVRLLASTHAMPMWLPVKTRDTRKEPETSKHRRRHISTDLWVKFTIYSAIVAVAGWALSLCGMAIAVQTGLSQGLVGGVFTAVATSLPELVIAITAVRMGSLTLAVGDIIGGNTFDTLFISMSDLVYREGSIYGKISPVEHLWLAISMLMTGVLLMGLLYRERHGIANIGWESFLLLVIYGCGLVFISL
jgi:cation:H+ antiporter